MTHADKLSRHLAKKMEEIGERLQKATIEVTDLEGQVMTNRAQESHGGPLPPCMAQSVM